MTESRNATDEGSALLLPQAACSALCHDLPRAAGLDAAMRIVEGVRSSLLGDGLLTVNLNTGLTAQDAQTVEPPPGEAPGHDDLMLQRIWSSNPVAYPVAGRKRKTMTPWTRQLLQRAEVFIGQGDAALKEIFDDHALIASLGLRAVVNVPLLNEQGACFATFNALGTRPQWKPQDVWLLRLLATLATPAIRRSAALAA